MSTKTAIAPHLWVIEGGSKGPESSSASIPNLVPRQVEFVRQLVAYLSRSPSATQLTETEITQMVNQLLRTAEVRYHRIEGGGEPSPSTSVPSGWFLRPREEAAAVDWQEKYLDKLDRDISDMKASLKATEERIGQMVSQTLAEMRDRDNQRHAELLALRTGIQAEVQQIRTEIQQIRVDNQETRKWVIGMVISAIGVAIAAIVGMVTVALTVLQQ